MVSPVLALAVAAAITLPDAHICSQPPPPGTGLRADGRGLVHIMQGGVYTFIGAKVNTLDAGYFNAGSFGSVQQTASTVEWIRPDGVREPIPTRYLYPPF